MILIIETMIIAPPTTRRDVKKVTLHLSLERFGWASKELNNYLVIHRVLSKIFGTLWNGKAYFMSATHFMRVLLTTRTSVMQAPPCSSWDTGRVVPLVVMFIGNGMVWKVFIYLATYKQMNSNFINIGMTNTWYIFLT